MRVLLDTNILSRSYQPSHEHHDLAVRSVATLRSRGDSLFLVPQNFYEFWVVATRPTGENGLGMDAATAKARFDELKRAYTLLEDTPALFPTWEKLVTQRSVIGKPAHDARLVAAMQVHNLEGVLTFNHSHFSRYPVTVLGPAEVSSTG